MKIPLQGWRLDNTDDVILEVGLHTVTGLLKWVAEGEETMGEMSGFELRLRGEYLITIYHS